MLKVLVMWERQRQHLQQCEGINQRKSTHAYIKHPLNPKAIMAWLLTGWVVLREPETLSC